MQLTTITYHRKKNLGNYETEDISLSAELEQGEDHLSAIEKLKIIARQALNISEPKPKPEPKQKVTSANNFDDQPF